MQTLTMTDLKDLKKTEKQKMEKLSPEFCKKMFLRSDDDEPAAKRIKQQLEPYS